MLPVSTSSAVTQRVRGSVQPGAQMEREGSVAQRLQAPPSRPALLHVGLAVRHRRLCGCFA